MSETSNTVTIKRYYGTDPVGFFWAGSAQKRKDAMDVRRNAPAEFEATYQGRPGQRVGTIFRNADFVYYEPPEDLELGIVAPAVRQFCEAGHAVFQAWDTAFSTSAESAHSVCVTGLFVPCSSFHRSENSTYVGVCDYHFDVIILDVFRKKLDYGDLLEEVKRQYYKWQPELVIIEKRASGISLIQTLPSANIPIMGLEVGSASKGERAINRVDARGAGSVQGWCRQHRVKFPGYAPWLDVFVAELKDFSGENDSSSDQVDSFVHLVTHAIRISSTTTLFPTSFGVDQFAYRNDTTFGVDGPYSELFVEYLGGIQDHVFDPYDGMCGRCSNYSEGYCALQRRTVISLDSCGEFRDRADPG